MEIFCLSKFNLARICVKKRTPCELSCNWLSWVRKSLTYLSYCGLWIFSTLDAEMSSIESYWCKDRFVQQKLTIYVLALLSPSPWSLLNLASQIYAIWKKIYRRYYVSQNKSLIITKRFNTVAFFRTTQQ